MTFGPSERLYNRTGHTGHTEAKSHKSTSDQGAAMCPHMPQCPDAHATDREAARAVASHPEQGWTLLCNGIVIFEDTGELLPGGEIIAPHRTAALR